MTHPAHLDPLLLALVEKLPSPDDVFTSGDRERWLAAMDAALGLLYAPAWAGEARRKAKEARTGAEPHDCSHAFPTMTAGQGGVFVAGPVATPVLVVPPADPVVLRGSKEDLKAIKFIPTGQVESLDALGEFVQHAQEHVERTLAAYAERIEEAPSTTSADAVDDESGGEEAPDSGAGPAPDTSPPPASGLATDSLTAPSTSAPSSPSTVDPAPDKPKIGDTRQPERIEPGTLKTRGVRKKTFNAAEKGAFVRRAVREGVQTVATDSGIHPTTINRWMREMPKSVERFEAEWVADQAQAEAGPTVAELEAEKAAPVPKPEVRWPSGPMERRPIDPERVRRAQADAQ